MRVLFVCNNPAYFELHWAWRARAIAAAGHDVAVVVPRRDDGRPPRIDGIETLELRLDRKGTDPTAELRSLRDLGAHVRAWRPDLMHGVTAKPNLYTGWWGRRLRIPVVMSVTGLGTVFLENTLHYRLIRAGVLAAYRHVARNPRSRLLFENEDDHAVFLDAGIAHPSRLILQPGVGVDVSHYVPSPRRRVDPPLVILPARMLWPKGIGEFVEAARLLRARGHTLRMALVGEPDPGNPATISEAQLRAWSADGLVEWWGFRSDMPSVFASASIVCLPSYREGLPRVLLEAAACGLPCITTDTPGCRRAVVDGETGLLVPPRDGPAIAAAITRLLDDTSMAQRMGDAGRARIVLEFSEEQVLAETFRIYAEASQQSP